AWQETFVPMELMRHLRNVTVPGPDGEPVPLVAEESTAFEADRAPPPAEAPNRFVVFRSPGLVLAGGLLLLARSARSRRFARGALALGILFWGLITGFFGVILALLWLFTDHTAAYPNLNLLQMNPFGLLLAAAAPLAVVGSRVSRIARLAWPVALALASLSALGVLLHAVPSLRQMNAPLIALLLPVHLAVVLALYHVRSAHSSTAGDATVGVQPSAAP